MSNSNHFTKVQISAKIYWGFNIEIPTDRIILMSDEEIVNEIKDFMLSFFKIYGLEELREGVNTLSLHIHDRPQSPADIIYVCNHN